MREMVEEERMKEGDGVELSMFVKIAGRVKNGEEWLEVGKGVVMMGNGNGEFLGWIVRVLFARWGFWFAGREKGGGQ